MTVVLPHLNVRLELDTSDAVAASKAYVVRGLDGAVLTVRHYAHHTFTPWSIALTAKDGTWLRWEGHGITLAEAERDLIKSTRAEGSRVGADALSIMSIGQTMKGRAA
jgi:hypothetical protein